MRITNIETARFIYMMIREGLEVDRATKRNLRAFMCEQDPELNQSLISALRNGMEVTICTDYKYGEDFTKVFCIEEPMTDKELEEYYQSGQIHSPYDCTGQRFIQGVHQFYSKFLQSWVVVERSSLDV